MLSIWCLTNFLRKWQTSDWRSSGSRCRRTGKTARMVSHSGRSTRWGSGRPPPVERMKLHLNALGSLKETLPITVVGSTRWLIVSMPSASYLLTLIFLARLPRNSKASGCHEYRSRGGTLVDRDGHRFRLFRRSVIRPGLWKRLVAFWPTGWHEDVENRLTARERPNA